MGHYRKDKFKVCLFMDMYDISPLRATGDLNHSMKPVVNRSVRDSVQV
jgi:hypothetical protein